MQLRFVLTLTFVAMLVPLQGQTPAPSWPQWGGPTRNFVAAPAQLAPWPASGPRQLWSRALGEGHSAIAEDRGRLFTSYRPAGWMSMVRRTQEEVVGSFDAATGKTLWEYRYPAPTSDVDFSAGAGPHGTPLVMGGMVFATSSMKELFALNRDTGKLVWSHHLMREYGAPAPGRGYTCSPLAYGDQVIVTAGGANQAVMSFRRSNGALVWKAGDFSPSPASPMLIDVGGQTQLVVLGGDRVVGMNPTDGTVLWSHPHVTQYGLNISTPVWTGGNELFISSAYDGGSRLLRLARDGARTVPSEAWFTSRMRVHFGSVLRIGEHYYGSSGDFGPAFLVAVDAKTGKVGWQDRSFARAQLVNAGSAVVVLDEDGTLGIVTLSPGGMKTLSRASVMTGTSWTAPTVVGTRVYLRDRKNMVALDLAK
jgi:outer membrane protein assembly factor BamB